MPDQAISRQHDDQRLQVFARLVELHYRHSPLALFSSAVLGLLVALVLRGGAPPLLLGSWLTLVEAAMASRALVTMYYLHGGAQRLSLPAWTRITYAGAAFSGLSWGLLGLMYGMVSNPIHQLVIAFTLMGVCAGAASLVGSVPWSIQLFGTLALVPLAGAMFGMGDRSHFYLGAALLYYLWVVMYKGPRRIERAIHNVIVSGLARDELLVRLEDAERMAHVAHIAWDHTQGLGTLSAEARRLYGTRTESSSDANLLWNAVVEEDRPRVMTLAQEAVMRRHAEVRFETAIRADAGLREFQVVQRFEYRSDGSPLRTMTTLLDITELKRTQRELHLLAFRDPLTRLANRALFQDRLRKVVERALRHDLRVGVLMMDLDNFKTVNDTLGHAAGDRLLVEAAERLRLCVRSYDTVARLGGDEFAVVLPDVRRALDVGTVAGKIIEAMSAPFRIDDHEMFVSASIGIAVCPSDADSAEVLMRHADIALFEAKAKGRANFQFYSADLTRRARERMGLEADLRRAMARGELTLHYQPKIRISDGVLVGAEALLRWHHPERGMVPPDQFIGLAEDTGLIVPLGAWVLRTAFATARDWNQGRDRQAPLKIAVNLSPRQFINHDVVATARDALADTGCSAEWIELELTESLLLDERGKIQDSLQALRSLGFTLAIDDFGTGYSALGYLTRFPITTLKIDRSFTQDITTKPDRAGIVRAIVSMGHSLKLELVAEGVETAGQAAILRELGCQLAQGWLYGAAVSHTDFDQRHRHAGRALTAPSP